MRLAVCTVFILCATTAAAQNAQLVTPVTVTPASNFEVLVGVLDVVHVADMLTTSYNLTHPSRTLHAVEGNPLLRPFSGSPGTLAAVTSVCSSACPLRPSCRTLLMVARHLTRGRSRDSRVRAAATLQLESDDGRF